MWQTSYGNRTLAGAEAALVKAAVTAVAEQIQEESGGFENAWGYGIELFDELTWTQRLMLLDRVATYLLTDTHEPLELTAVNESVIGVLFERIRIELDLEILDEELPPPDYRWRELALAALKQPIADNETESQVPDGEHEPQSVECADHRRWHNAAESLTDRILSDRDYEMAGNFLDQSPDQAQLFKSYLGIGNDYYCTPAPDVISDSTLEATYRRLGVYPR